jgi:cysteine desulfurase
MIYADYNATTPCLPEVVEAMRAALAEPGNPSSRHHAPGRRAAAALDQARGSVAALIGAEPEQIVFTSGATEACNLAILGVAERLLAQRRRFVFSATEHPAVLEPHRRLRAAKAEVVKVGVDHQGRLDLGALEFAIDESTALVSVMLVNNETGVIHDVADASDAAHAVGALLLCDATQAAGRLPIDVTTLKADFVALSAHKLYGPQGVGALWIRRGLSLEPQILGGGQERGIRSGTHNLPGIVGFGVAAELARRDLAARRAHLGTLTSRLEAALKSALPGLVIQGAATLRAAGTSFVTLPGLPRGWLAQLAEVAASSGSSCASGTGEPSHVLQEMGMSDADAANSVRISLGVPTTAADVDAIAAALIAGAKRLRERSA